MYDTLFSDIQIGRHTVKNRIVFCGPVTGFAKDGQPTTQLAAYYLERAKGGAGLIELEPALKFDKDCIDDWAELAERIHTYGTKLVAAFKIPLAQPDTEAGRVCQGIAESAELLSYAGFDGISLYPVNRLQEEQAAGTWIKKLILGISESCGERFITGVHLSPPVLGGNRVSPTFPEDLRADYLVLPNDSGFDDFRAAVPIIKTVEFTEPNCCEALLGNGGADLAGLSWQLICDPYWPVKAELGKEKEIRKHDCFEEDDHASSAGRISCTLNPYLGKESRYSEFNMAPAAKLKNVVVVGGGPAGMQAGITASKRGHNVFLFESEDELGGNKLRTPDYTDALSWLVGEMKRNQVDARLGVYVTAKHVEALKPDIVIMAVGGNDSRKSMIPPLHEKGIQVVDVNCYDCSVGQAIRSGFNVAIDI